MRFSAALGADLFAGRLLNRESYQSSHIPYLRHVDDQTIVTRDGFYLSVIRLDGINFKTRDLNDLNAYCHQRNTAFKALGSSNFALYAHLIRTGVRPELEGDYAALFADRLNRAHFRQLAKQRMFANDQYLTVIRKPMVGALGLVEKVLSFGRNSHEQTETEQDAIEDLRKKTETLCDGMRSIYNARILKVRETDIGLMSEPCEFLFRLMNGARDQNVFLPRMALSDYLPASRLFFGRNAIEIAAPDPDDSRYAAMVSIKEYPAWTGPGMLDRLMELPHEFILTQSFRLLEKQATLTDFERRGGQSEISDEKGTSVSAQIGQARDDLMSDRVAFGMHHFSVMCLEKTPEALDNAIYAIETALTGLGLITVHEDLNTEPSYWAQLPGNFAYIARTPYVSTLNFAGFFSGHGFPSGQSKGLRWGKPVSLLQTTSHTPYLFSFHNEDVGHFIMTGQTGSGKTLLMLFLLAQAGRVHPDLRTIIFDSQRGAENYVLAMGGRYEALTPGEPTGFNPLQMDDTRVNRAFLVDLLCRMVAPATGHLEQTERQVVADAVARIMTIPKHGRTLSELTALLRGRLRGGLDSLAARMDRWLNEDGWLFNNPVETIDWATLKIAGFDTTEICKDDTLRGLALPYMFHRLEELMDGRTPFIIFIDEAWSALGDEVFRKRIKEWYTTIRRKNGIVGIGLQSASDIVNSPVGQTLIEQTVTSIFFSNPKGEPAHYQGKLGLSDREFQFIRETPKEARQFLIRHINDSLIGKLDLAGMDDFIKVLSTRPNTAAEARALIATYGPEPENWLHQFCGWEP